MRQAGGGPCSTRNQGKAENIYFVVEQRSCFRRQNDLGCEQLTTWKVAKPERSPKGVHSYLAWGWPCGTTYKQIFSFFSALQFSRWLRASAGQCRTPKLNTNAGRHPRASRIFGIITAVGASVAGRVRISHFSGTQAGRIWDASPIKCAGRGHPLQPGGLPDGSRGSRRRRDPRSWAVRVCTPERGARNTYASSRLPSGIPPGCKTQH